MFFIRILVVATFIFVASSHAEIALNKSNLVVDALHPPCKKDEMYKNASEMVGSLLFNKGLPFNPNCISRSQRKDRMFLKELVYIRHYTNEQLFNIADKSLRKNQAFITDVVVANDENYDALAYADKGLRKNRAFMLKMLRITSYSLEYASDDLKKDRRFVWEAVKGNFGSSALSNADISIRQDKYFVLAVIQLRGGEALFYVDDNLKKDRDVVLAAVKTYPKAIKWAHRSLQQDQDLIAVANATKKEQMLKSQRMQKEIRERREH
ncbi:MAG: DUF4116 domain-containing protein [Cocleimonas sp.]|nr:DUF4116 domain-containing protein [Cocleimonas sp.]